MDGCVTQATGLAERETALAMATNLPAGATLGASSFPRAPRDVPAGTVQSELRRQEADVR